MAIALPAAFACASATEPTIPTQAVAIPPDQADAYWSEVQRRVPAWFQTGGVEAPQLPSKQSVYSRVHFVEVPHEYLATCTFNRDTLEIRIGDDKWDSGCVPHELAHAALWVLKHPCWADFEHPNEDPTRC